MLFPSPLLKGTLIQRYKRFLADIELETGEVITTHCANSGSMLGLKDPGSTVWVTKIPAESERKLRYDFQIVEDAHFENAWVGINTTWPNKLTAEALKHGHIAELSMYKTFKPEVPYGTQNSRIDFFLTGEGLPNCYLEVKNVTLRMGNTVQFPDAVTARGTKHLQELMGVVDHGHRAVVLYVVQRTDGVNFQVANHIDPLYASTAKAAKEKGVEFLCYRCAITKEGLTLNAPLPML